ncbi:MAG: nucleotide exchange factor GrpE [Acidimicrobiia bacterium]
MRPDDEASNARGSDVVADPPPDEDLVALIDRSAAPETAGAPLDEAGEPTPPNAGVMALDLPSDPEEAQAVLIGALIETRGEADEYLETMQRVAAEFGNYRKRVERDHADVVVRAAQHVVERLLPALDSFDAALAYEPQTPAEEKILDGMRGTHGQLLDILGREGLAPVPAVGHPFDPAVHEAVAGPADGGDHLVVAQELRRGYVLQTRLIRPSLVVVEAVIEESDTERS